MTSSLQGTATWLQARIGKMTASRAYDVCARKKDGKPYAGFSTYLYELVQERLTGIAAEHFTSPAMEHGTATEGEAALAYAMERGVTLTETGFIDHPTIAMAGASPDRLVGTDGMWEAKCPNPGTHLATLMGEPIKPRYIYQMQWQMACCPDREWNDFNSYDGRFENPALQSKIIRVPRDNALIAEMEEHAAEFLQKVADTVADLEGLSDGVDLSQKEQAA